MKLAMATLLVACGGNDQQDAGAVSAPGPVADTARAGPAAIGTGGGFPARPAGGHATSTGAPADGAPLDGRTGELLHPDDGAIVLLYHDLAGIPIAFDPIVEEDQRVRFAQPADKAAMRETARSELAATRESVRGVGFIRLSTDGKLSKYDPAYGEFTIGAFSPGSVYNFAAYRQKVALKLGNGRQVQVWQVPPEEAQAITDKLDSWGGTSLDVLLRIRGVQPAPGGGTIVADVAEFELRETRANSTLARVRVDPQ